MLTSTCLVAFLTGHLIGFVWTDVVQYSYLIMSIAGQQTSDNRTSCTMPFAPAASGVSTCVSGAADPSMSLPAFYTKGTLFHQVAECPRGDFNRVCGTIATPQMLLCIAHNHYHQESYINMMVSGSSACTARHSLHLCCSVHCVTVDRASLTHLMRLVVQAQQTKPRVVNLCGSHSLHFKTMLTFYARGTGQVKLAHMMATGLQVNSTVAAMMQTQISVHNAVIMCAVRIAIDRDFTCMYAQSFVCVCMLSDKLAVSWLLNASQMVFKVCWLF